jgi:hypothetical protein
VALDGAYVPFFGAFGAAWDDAMVARGSANLLAIVWLEIDAARTALVLGQARSPGRRMIFAVPRSEDQLTGPVNSSQAGVRNSYRPSRGTLRSPRPGVCARQ